MRVPIELLDGTGGSLRRRIAEGCKTLLPVVVVLADSDLANGREAKDGRPCLTLVLEGPDHEDPDRLLFEMTAALRTASLEVRPVGSDDPTALDLFSALTPVYFRNDRVEREFRLALTLRNWDRGSAQALAQSRLSNLSRERIESASAAGWRPSDDAYLQDRLIDLDRCVEALRTPTPDLARGEADWTGLAVEHVLAVASRLMRESLAYIWSSTRSLPPDSVLALISVLAKSHEMTDELASRLRLFPYIETVGTSPALDSLLTPHRDRRVEGADTVAEFASWAERFVVDQSPGRGDSSPGGVIFHDKGSSGSGQPCSIWAPDPNRKRR